jgi:hypothetical protein
MRIRLLLAAAATVTLAACSESPTAPQKMSPGGRLSDGIVGITCRSGYHIATRADGSEYCEPDGGGESVAGPTTMTTTSKN